MTVDEVLNSAADLIEERGWWNGEGDITCRQGECAFTALAASSGVVLGDDPTERFRMAHDTFAVHIGAENAQGSRDIADWNDSRTDAGEVVAALRAASLVASVAQVLVA